MADEDFFAARDMRDQEEFDPVAHEEQMRLEFPLLWERFGELEVQARFMIEQADAHPEDIDFWNQEFVKVAHRGVAVAEELMLPRS